MNASVLDVAIQRVVQLAVARQREEFVALLQELVRSSGRGDDAAQEFVADTLAGWGLTVETIRRSPTGIVPPREIVAVGWLDPEPRTSVVARWNGHGHGRSLMIWAHPDSVQVPDTSNWTHGPFAAHREDGKIYGLGIADDKSGVAAGMAAVRTLQRIGVELHGDVVIGSCASKRNAQGIVAALERGFVTDGSIYLHPAESGNGLGDIKGATCGVLTFRILLQGSEPDTTEPNQVPFAHLGVNAIERAVAVMQALMHMETELGRKWHHHALEEAMGGRATRLSFEAIEAAAEFGRVPTQCQLRATLVFPPGIALSTVQEAVETTVGRVRLPGSSPTPQLEWLFGTEGAEVSEDHPLFQIASAAIEASTGLRPNLYRLHAHSDIRVPHHFNGTVCLGFGPRAGNSSQIGRADEWLDELDFLRMIHAIALTILAWCGHEPLEDSLSADPPG